MTNFWHRYFGGHFTLGPLTVYGANAMDWAVNVKSRWGYICFTLPTLRRFVKGGWYFYLSPNGTPWASTFYLGVDRNERKLSRVRRIVFGHGFNTEKHADQLYKINNT